MISLESPTIGEICLAVSQLFHRAGFESPQTEARQLLSGYLRCPSTSLLLRGDEVLDDEVVLEFKSFVSRRLQHEPTAYILGHKNFMGYEMVVSPSVLIPRPETELLVEDILMEVRDSGSESKLILDMCTGSGCIAVSLALLLPEARLTACDISPEALEVAHKNAEKWGVQIEFIQSDLFAQIAPGKGDGFDMILANPPYIASPDFLSVQPELSFEPQLALSGGFDGLNTIRPLIQQSLGYLKPGGLLEMEIGHNQGNLVRDLLGAAGFRDISILKDYSGHDRIAKGRTRGSI